MGSKHLKEYLRPWVRVDTWHTTHPLDQERFHKALDYAFRGIGGPIDYDGAKDAIVDLANECHPNLNPEFVEEAADRYAQSVERISGYLDDTNKFNK